MAVSNREDRVAVSKLVSQHLLSGLFFLLSAFAMALEATENPAQTYTSIAINEIKQKGVSDIQVRDDVGRLVHLPRPAQRIVALSPHIVENLYSAGLGSSIVAAVNYADYPEAASALPRVGGFANFGIEAILRFQPDLVVGWGSGYSGFMKLVDQLESLGIAVYVDEPRTMADIARSIGNLAVLGGTQQVASDVIEAFYVRLDELKQQQSERLGEQAVSVFYPIWPEPLQTLSGKHIVSDVIRLCGGVNIFQNVPVLAPKIGIESVLAENPELIVASSSGGERPAWLELFDQWQEIAAIQNEQVYYIDGDLLSRHTVRMLEGVDLMCDYISRARQFR